MDHGDGHTNLPLYIESRTLGAQEASLKELLASQGCRASLGVIRSWASALHHVLPGTRCSSPLLPAGFAPATSSHPLFGNTGDSPNTELDLFKVASYFSNVYLLVPQSVFHVAGVQ